MDKAKTAQKYSKTRRRRGENTANVRKDTEKSVKIGENAGGSIDFLIFLGGDCIFRAFARRFSRLLGRFFFLGRAFPAFLRSPPLLFAAFFLLVGLKFAIFGVSFLFFCCQRLLFMDKRCFFLIFYGKRRKQAKKQAKFRRIHALFLRFLCLLSAFWLIFLVFFACFL